MSASAAGTFEPARRTPYGACMTNILLTGASRGIGAAIREALAPNATVLGQATRAADGLLAADLAQPAASIDLWRTTIDRLGTIDVLINNAGVFEANPLDAEDDAWRES